MTPNPLNFRAKNLADAERHIIACQALVEVLQTDPRVDALYQAWLQRTGLAELLTQLQQANDLEFRDGVQAEIVLCLYGAGIVMRTAMLPPLISQDLRLPYPWLLDHLHAALLSRFGREAGTDLGVLTVGILPSGKVARGRRAKNRGESIRRDVDWFYRACIQEPRESIHALSREYVRSAGSRSEARSVVQDGIARAKAVLDDAATLLRPARGHNRKR